MGFKWYSVAILQLQVIDVYQTANLVTETYLRSTSQIILLYFSIIPAFLGKRCQRCWCYLGKLPACNTAFCFKRYIVAAFPSTITCRQECEHSDQELQLAKTSHLEIQTCTENSWKRLYRYFKLLKPCACTSISFKKLEHEQFSPTYKSRFQQLFREIHGKGWQKIACYLGIKRWIEVDPSLYVSNQSKIVRSRNANTPTTN